MEENWGERVSLVTSYLSLKEMMLHSFLALMRKDQGLPHKSQAHLVNGSYERPTSYPEFVDALGHYEVKLNRLLARRAIAQEEYSEGVNLLLEMRQLLLQRGAQGSQTANT